MEKLKPCPFNTVNKFFGHDLRTEKKDNFWFVKCSCGASGSWSSCEELAVENWNSRLPLEDLLKDYECKEDCEFRYGKECCLGIVHCIRMAEDFYKPKNSSKS